jgi:hypothetical protein
MKFFPGWKGHEQLYGDGITEDYPSMSCCQASLAASDRPSKRSFGRDRLLFEVPVNLMNRKMREPAVYISSFGNRRGCKLQAEISTKVGCRQKAWRTT